MEQEEARVLDMKEAMADLAGLEVNVEQNRGTGDQPLECPLVHQRKT